MHSKVPVHLARILFVALGKRQIDFAEYHGCSAEWVTQVLHYRAPAPKRFRRDLSAFLQVPEENLFPEYQEAERARA